MDYRPETISKKNYPTMPINNHILYKDICLASQHFAMQNMKKNHAAVK